MDLVSSKQHVQHKAKGQLIFLIQNELQEIPRDTSTLVSKDLKMFKHGMITLLKLVMFLLKEEEVWAMRKECLQEYFLTDNSKMKRVILKSRANKHEFFFLLFITTIIVIVLSYYSLVYRVW